jgi:hypothetical protein
MIWQVRSTLPDIVKDLLKDEEYTNWAEFTKAVTELKGSRLVEKQEQHNRQTQEFNALKTDLARIHQRTPIPNPVDALQKQLNQMSINTTNSTTTPQSNSGYARAPASQNRQNAQSTYSRQPSNTTTTQQPVVITDELKTSVKRLIAAFPHHPDTPAGNAAHTTQIAQWNTRWGESTRVTHETDYPLKPGTAAICSGECFACGTHGHNSHSCILPPGDAARLERKESAWRAVSSRVLGSFNRFSATPISLVINDGYETMSAWIEEVPEQQGKADGSA